MWKKIRSGVMFGIACVASPCCTPLIVPLGLALLAGTPIAVWLSANLGWVYGGLTMLSIISLVLGFRWMRQKSDSKRFKPKTTVQPIQEITRSQEI
jgi:predicted MFS family arabinose efflux permease